MSRILVLLSFFVSITAFAQQKYHRIHPKLDSVTVFSQQAQLHLSTSILPIPKGKSIYYFTGISGLLDPKSIQVMGKGIFTIASVGYELNDREALLKQKEDTLRKIELLFKSTQMALQVVEQKEKIMMANASFKSEVDGLLPDDFQELLAIFEEKLTENGQKKIELEEKIAQLQQTKTTILTSISEQDKPRIKVEVLATQDTDGQFILHYLSNGASWRPLYTARVTDIDQPITIQYQAEVYQNTGISWDNVKLSLSTATPTQGGEKPSLSSVFVDQQPAFVAYTKVAMPPPPVMGKARMSASSEAMVEDMPMATTSADWVSVSESIITQFSIRERYTIPSNNTAQKIDIQQFTLPAKYEYQVVPKKATDGFITTEIQDWTTKNLLSGPVSLFWSGTYLGESTLDVRDLSKPLTLSLGRDKSIISQYEPIREWKTKKSFIGGEVKETFEFKTTVHNTKNRSIELKVEDQIPVSRDERIEISGDFSGNATLNKETGIVTWQVQLAPNEKRVFTTQYTLKYPKEMRLRYQD
ncbi:MAG: DUF4139 domain-containing protein [Spirosomataceae bacterium]